MTSVRPEERLFAVQEADPVEVAKIPAGSAKTFRHYDQAQSFLLPPSLDDWLPAGHTARFISETVEEALDLCAIYASYENATGAPPFDPRMMTKLLLYGYSVGVTSSRETERRCQVDVAFRYLCANVVPDYRSIARFRRRHLAAIESLFTQVLVLCHQAGLCSLGRVALDGTKVRAAASRHKAMSYDRMGRAEAELRKEVEAILAEAEATDLAEDEAYGEDRWGDELPEELQSKEGRRKAIQAAKAAIEAEARERAETEAAEKAKRQGKSGDEIDRAAKAAGEAARPSPRAQRNFTDPDARIMKTADGSFHYAYNAQAVVDESHQVVLSTVLVQEPTDVNQLLAMIEKMGGQLAAAGVAAQPKVLLADAGYCSKANIEGTAQMATDVLLATGRLKHGEKVPDSPRGRIPKDATARERMARRLRTRAGRVHYARRKAIVEPVFGQLKTRQRAGYLRLRGLERVRGEWLLHALCHNLRKLENAGSALGVE
jgi:transposase